MNKEYRWKIRLVPGKYISALKISIPCNFPVRVEPTARPGNSPFCRPDQPLKRFYVLGSSQRCCLRTPPSNMAQTTFGFPSYMVVQNPFGGSLVIPRGNSRLGFPRRPTTAPPTFHPSSSYPSGRLRQLPYDPPQPLPLELTHRELRERRDSHRAARRARAKESKERARWERENRLRVKFCPKCNCQGVGCQRDGQSNPPPPQLGLSFPPRFPTHPRYRPRYTPLRPTHGWRVCPAYRPPPSVLPAPAPLPPPSPPPRPFILTYLSPAQILTSPGEFFPRNFPALVSSNPHPGPSVPQPNPRPSPQPGIFSHRPTPLSKLAVTRWAYQQRMLMVGPRGGGELARVGGDIQVSWGIGIGKASRLRERSPVVPWLGETWTWPEELREGGHTRMDVDAPEEWVVLCGWGLAKRDWKGKG